MRIRSVLGHTAIAVAEAFLVVAIIAAILVALSPVYAPARDLAGTGDAAATTSWIAIRGTTALAASAPRLGAAVAFDAGYPKTVRNPRVAVKCYQDGVLVYAEAGGVDESFVLGGGSSDWLRSGGSASCEADLFYFTYKGKVQSYHWLASTAFDAAG